jgi:hypothetical protein
MIEILPCPRLIWIYYNGFGQEFYSYYCTESSNGRRADAPFKDITRWLCQESRLVFLAHYHLLEHFRPPLLMNQPGGIDWSARKLNAEHSRQSDSGQSWRYIDGTRDTIVLREDYITEDYSERLDLRRVQNVAFHGDVMQNDIERGVATPLYSVIRTECPALRTFSFILGDSVSSEYSYRNNDRPFCQLIPVNEIYEYEGFKVNFSQIPGDKYFESGQFRFTFSGKQIELKADVDRLNQHFNEAKTAVQEGGNFWNGVEIRLCVYSVLLPDKDDPAHTEYSLFSRFGSLEATHMVSGKVSPDFQVESPTVNTSCARPMKNFRADMMAFRNCSGKVCIWKKFNIL